MNILQKSISVVMFAGAALIGTAACATTFNFDFTGSNLSDRSSVSYVVDGLTVTVTAGTFGNSNPSSINYNSRNVDIDSNGLGADASLDSDTVDGSLGNDVLVFSFSQGVTIDTIGFSEVDGNDDFAFGSVVGNSFDRVVNFEDVLTSVDASGFASAALRTGFGFGIGAIGGNDNFRITSLSVSSVPLPASGLMLLAAMGLGAGVARRRKAKAA